MRVFPAVDVGIAGNSEGAVEPLATRTEVGPVPESLGAGLAVLGNSGLTPVSVAASSKATNAKRGLVVVLAGASATTLLTPPLALELDALVATMRELDPLALDRQVTGMVVQWQQEGILNFLDQVWHCEILLCGRNLSPFQNTTTLSSTRRQAWESRPSISFPKK